MDWIKGKITGKPHDLNGKIYGFRFQFSLNQSIDHSVTVSEIKMMGDVFFGMEKRNINVINLI